MLRMAEGVTRVTTELVWSSQTAGRVVVGVMRVTVMLRMDAHVRLRIHQVVMGVVRVVRVVVMRLQR